MADEGPVGGGDAGRESSGEVLLALRVEGAGGAFEELVVTDDDEVIHITGGRQGARRVETVRRRRREIDRFLWEVEALGPADSQRHYGGDSRGPGSWRLVMQSEGQWRHWSGGGRVAPHWDELMALAAGLLGRPFPAGT